MSDIAIKVEDLGKLYRLGEISTGTITQDLNRWWARMRGKEDPFTKIGETNDRTTKGTSDYVWALKDVNFEVRKGEVLGIIGRNGAGKSTLLKILSKITAPSTGRINVAGRIASLLEVGTGFHPELTGRENIFLNGAILGMTKAEIRSKFDEIVDFSGVERYIDTPVKRYSSGMYVRLAFAVAAFLEPEILIVDEVLAVGDAEFQKKCLGRMQDVSKNDGRTVLFVSHDMAAVTTLTSHSICLERGGIVINGNTSEVIKYYLENARAVEGVYSKKPNEHKPTITRVEVITSEPNYIHTHGKDLNIDIEVNTNEVTEGMAVSIQVFNSKEIPVLYTYVFDVNQQILRTKGVNRLTCSIKNCKLYQGHYYLKVHLAESKGRVKFEEVDKICEFEVKMMNKMVEWGWQENVCTYLEDFKWHNYDTKNISG